MRRSSLAAVRSRASRAILPIGASERRARNPDARPAAIRPLGTTNMKSRRRFLIDASTVARLRATWMQVIIVPKSSVYSVNTRSFPVGPTRGSTSSPVRVSRISVPGDADGPADSTAGRVVRPRFDERARMVPSAARS
jgi:hypothetical protein